MRIKQLFKDSKWILLSGIIFLLVLFCLIKLYNFSMEFFLYVMLFGAVFTIINAIIVHKKCLQIEKKYEKMKPEIREEDDKKWIEAKEKEDFFGLWTHQIKTPISALNLLLQSEEPDIKQCKLETFKIEQYVEMALNYLRFDTMGNDLLLEPYNLESIVKTVVKKHASIFINKRLSIQLENLNYTVLTDDKWFSFVLEQIISNAVKYTKEGGITVTARQEGNYLLILVKDSGMGIRKEDLPRIFEKGFTGFNGRKDKKASGLGLYLCEGICKKLGHEIWIESEINQGTTVYLKVKAEMIEKNDLGKM